jgi:hypothetical protein
MHWRSGPPPPLVAFASSDGGRAEALAKAGTPPRTDADTFARIRRPRSGVAAAAHSGEGAGSAERSEHLALEHLKHRAPEHLSLCGKAFRPFAGAVLGVSFGSRHENNCTVGLGVVAAGHPRNPMGSAFFRMNLICTRDGH